MTLENPLEGLSVLFVIPHTPESVGFESGNEFLSLAAYHDNYCTVVSELGADVELVHLDDDEPPEWDAEYQIRTEDVTVGSSYGVEFSVPLYYSLARTDADIVHVHGYNQLNVLPILGALAATDAKIVVQNHGSALDYGSTKYRAWYTLLRFVFPLTTDEIVSVNQDELRNLERIGISSEKLVYLPNAVDTNLFHPMDEDQCRDDLGMDDDVYQLLFVGKITENKGVTYLAEAMCELPPDVHLTLVYSGVDKEELARVEDTLAEGDAHDKVTFVGAVEQARLPVYYNAADVSVFPSVNEGFGVVTLESMACGTPVVVTTEHTSGGHLEDGENALVAEKRSAPSLAKSIQRLLESPKLRERLGQRGKETVQERYTWDQIGSKLATVYADS
ncbi:glycosyltransferase family 4 protein [Halobacterium hubeiense]|uniref:glycosyltransferase family 4 protein n=1 Tax=Halobacterium hubeiense TaxID=1407499 RepID=UPI003C77505F